LPEEERVDAVQYCMLLLEDENRDVLQCLLYFLHDIAQNSEIHKVIKFQIEPDSIYDNNCYIKIIFLSYRWTLETLLFA
jgi:hypothetical protein